MMAIPASVILVTTPHHIELLGAFAFCCAFWSLVGWGIWSGAAVLLGAL